MKIIFKLNDIIKRFEQFVLGTGTLLMAALLVANVIGRKVFGHSLSFAEEISAILSMFITFIGISYCARIGRHISMTVVYDILKPVGKKILLFITSIGTSVAMFYLAYISANYVQTLYMSGRFTNSLRIPFWVTHMALPVGFILAGIQYLLILFINIREKEPLTCLEPQVDEAEAVDEEIPMLQDQDNSEDEIAEKGEGE